MWTWILEEIKHWGRKQEEIEGEASEARKEMMMHQLPQTAFFKAKGGGNREGICRDGEKEPRKWEWAEKKAL